MVLHGAAAGTIELGNEPPLIIGNEEEPEAAPVHRAVSWRWLSGTILTGFTSIFLMGGALMAALDNPNQFASLSDAGVRVDAAASDVAFGHKGDRIRPIEKKEEVSSRQVLQVSTVTRQGERDFVKLRPFAKINATLVASADASQDIPPYDPLRIIADTSAPEPPPGDIKAAAASDDQFYGAKVDGEVSIKVSDFPAGDADFDNSPAAIADAGNVEDAVRAAAHLGSGDGPAIATLPLDGPAGAGPGSGDQDLAGDAGVRITAENVSNVAKTASIGGGAKPFDEKIVAIAKGESFRSLLSDNDVTSSDASSIIAALGDQVDLNSLRAGERVRIAFLPGADGGDTPRPIRVSIYDGGSHQATVARADNDSFVPANEPTVMPAVFTNTETVAEAPGAMPRLYDAVYRTALEQQVPKPLIEQLIRIFAFDVDYQSRISPGDSLEVFHSLPDPSDPEADQPEVLFAALTLNGVTKRFYRYRTPDDGIVDYYDEDGRSAKKFLIRKPVTRGRITSRFGWRKHPILGYRRLHPGVDYGAPRGTPILAAGNGVVEKAGWVRGYGRFTLIKHTNGYETAYGHQSKIASGIVRGARVHQGQIIGYVGSTGLSTGPHLHFEIRINHKPVNPLRIRLPRGRVLAGDMLASFERERERIDSLLGNGNAPSTKVASAAQ